MFKRAVLGWLGCVALLACEQAPGRVVSDDHTASPLVTPPTPSVAPLASASEPAATLTELAVEVPAVPTIPPSLCNEQTAEPFLVNAHFDSFNAAGGTAGEWKLVLERAVRYRTERYGYVKGFGERAWNASTPADHAQVITFFGVPVAVHQRIAPALSCVETAIRARCTDSPYQPYVLSGWRKRNTYLNGEISNHVYGIALDVDPSRNPCCGCIGEWRESERCQNDKDKFQRMDMPRCWVTEFERFGFYWLGRGKLEDTMHFEFLADPSQIVRQAEAQLVR